MKITREIKKDGESVYHMTVGFSELEALSALALEAFKKLPKKVFEIRPFRNRLDNMKTQMANMVEQYRKERGGGYTPRDYVRPLDK